MTEKSKGNDESTPDVAEEFKVEDRRHWAVEEVEDTAVEAAGEPARPTIVDEYRQRAEAAEQKLQEYIEAFKDFKRDQEEFRTRLNRDVDRRVELKFGELVGELLETIDNLELAMSHVESVPEAAALAEGVAMARDRFLATLTRYGVERLTPDGEPFDPNLAEAMRVDPVTDADRDGKVTQTLQPGYRLGELVVRPARVAVGRFVEGEPTGPDGS